jgi:TolB-like protein
MTAPGLIVGTPFYMAPEQAGGSPAGPAADIFSVGTILYEMLTGKRPFEGATIVDVLYAVRHQNPPPLSGSREIEALDRVIRCAMDKRIEARYSSAREMLAALDSISLSSSSEVALQTRTVTRMIVLPFRALKSDDHTDLLTFTLPEAISNSLSAMDNLIVRSSLLASRFEGQPDPRRVAVEADVDAFLTGSLLRAGNCFRLTCQLVEAPAGTVLWSETARSPMQDLFTVQDELCERILQSLRIPLDEREKRHSHRDVPATARAFECYLRANQISQIRTPNDMGLARDLYLQCIDESPNFAPAWARLGRVYHFLTKFGPVADNFVQAESAFNRAFDLNADLPIAHNWYTPLECDQGKANKAMLRLLKRARSRRNDPDLFAGLVQACRCCGELDASIAAHRRGRHLDPHLVTSAAFTYFHLGDYKSAIDCYGPGRRYYLDCAALAALGENQVALTLLRERENSGNPVLALMRSLRAYLEGDPEGCFNAIMQDEMNLLPDPEAYYYSARQLARIGKTDHAISALRSALDRGFNWTTAALSDPWFDSLRSLPQYLEVIGLAHQRSAEIHTAFLEAGGEQVIGVA